MDIDARIQLFDFKTKWQFTTTPGIGDYNMPMYNIQSSSLQNGIACLPLFQNLSPPVFINGIQVPWYTERNQFNNIWPNYQQPLVQAGTGNGSAGPYTLQLPFIPNASTGTVNQQSAGVLRGHLDINGIIAINNIAGSPQNVDPPFLTDPQAQSYIPQISFPSYYSQVFFSTTSMTNQNMVVQDTGLFLFGNGYCGLLMTPGNAPNGCAPLPNGPYTATNNTVNYVNGTAVVNFPSNVPPGVAINSSAVYYQFGLPRAALNYNNILTLRSPPDTQYVVELDAYLTPAAFLASGQSIPFGYMCEYIARGAARKILSDTGDIEQFNFYEPLFREQEILVWKRSQRQWTISRTQTIYSGMGYGNVSWGAGSGTGVT